MLRRVVLPVLSVIALVALALVAFDVMVRVGGDSGDGTTTPVSTSASPPSPPEVTRQVGDSDGSATLIVAGDIARCSEIDGAESTAQLVESMSGTVMTAGDNAYEQGTGVEFADCYDPTWGRFLDRTFAVPGNHDYLTDGAEGYFRYFGERAGPTGRGYYAIDVGAWRVYALSSEACRDGSGCDASSEQYRWLADDLAADPADCVAAVMHHPWLSSGRHGSDAPVRPLIDLLYGAGAELIIAGHDHDYERFAPARPDGQSDDENGLRQIVVGTGGASLRGRGGEAAPGSEVFDDSTHGVLRLTLQPGEYEWAFLPVGGETARDAGTGRCHAIPGA